MSFILRYHLRIIDSSYEEFSKVREELHAQSNISKSKLAAILTMKSVKLLWDKANIPYKQNKCSIENILKLHEKWRLLAKSKSKHFNKKNLLEQSFTQTLDGIFDNTSPSWKDDIRKSRPAKDTDEDFAWFTALKKAIKTGGNGVKDNMLDSSVRRKKEMAKKKRIEKKQMTTNKENRRKMNNEETVQLVGYSSDTEESLVTEPSNSMASASQNSPKSDPEARKDTGSDTITLVL